MKTTFHDAHERRRYILTQEIARRLLDDPELLKRGAEHMERFRANDPWQRRSYDLWCRTLRLPVEEIVHRLLEDSDEGAELRGSMPPFVVIEPSEYRRLLA